MSKTKFKKLFLKSVSLVSALALSVAVFGGCNAKDDSKDEQGRTVITVGGVPDTAGQELDAFNARKEAFEKANTDVVIEPNNWKFERKTFYSKAAGGQLPIVYNAGFTEVSEIVSSEYSADLTDALEKRGYLDKFNPQVLEAVSRDGRVYAIPKGVTVMGLMVNMDLFRAAGLVNEDGTPMQPKTWYEVAEFAQKIKEATGEAGFVIPTAGNSGGWLFSPIAWAFGVDFMEKDADGNWKATFNTPEAAEALQFIKDLKWKYNVLPDNILIDAPTWQETFGTGQAGITFGAGTYPATIMSTFGMKPESIGLIAMPEGPKKHITILSGDVICVSNDATEDQIDAAVRWIAGEVTPDATEEFKKNKEDAVKLSLDDNKIVGIKGLSIWDDNVEARVFEEQLIDENANVPAGNVKLYNDFAENCPCEIRPEEPVNCQELYGVLDACIQKVLEDENADPKTILEKANADFQQNYLDYAE